MILPAAHYLTAKLQAAGIPIDGCDSTGKVDYRPEATQAQRDQGAAIVAAFDWTLAAERAAEDAQATNERTIGDALESALAANFSALSTLTAWRSTGAGAGTANLTAAQSSAALRQMADNQISQFKELNGLIRLLRRKLDSAEGASLAKPAAPSA